MLAEAIYAYEGYIITVIPIITYFLYTWSFWISRNSYMLL